MSFMLACPTSQRYKHKHVALPGLLHPLSILDQAWEGVSMDFIERLPKSEGRDVILVIVDRLTKFAYFISMTYPCTA